MTTIHETQFSKALLWLEDGHHLALATVIETWGSSPRPVGAQLVIRDDGAFEGSVSGGCVEAAVIEQALIAIEKHTCTIVEYGIEGDGIFEAGLACGGKIRVLIETIGNGDQQLQEVQLRTLAVAEKLGEHIAYEVDLSDFSRQIHHGDVKPRSGVSSDSFTLQMKSPRRLIIIGAVHIAQFLAPLAQMVGFDVLLLDNRDIFADKDRFAGVEILKRWPSEALSEMDIKPQTAIVTLTHDDKFDIPALSVALKSPAFYIGALGSRKTQRERNAKLAEMGLDTKRIHGPVGLAIGAKSPSEIAISIMAEIISEMNLDE